MKNLKYCTHCGVQLLDKNNQPAYELYDEELHKKSNILKVMSCVKCGEIADKYIGKIPDPKWSPPLPLGDVTFVTL